MSFSLPRDELYCGRVGCAVPLRLADAEACWFCERMLCEPCWDKHGHCGHPEADAANENGRAHVQAELKRTAHKDWSALRWMLGAKVGKPRRRW